MALSLETNVESFVSKSGLKKPEAVERLGTASRINVSKDDAVSLGITHGQLGQARRNALDATSLHEGALTDQDRQLQKMREMAREPQDAINNQDLAATHEELPKNS